MRTPANVGAGVRIAANESVTQEFTIDNNQIVDHAGALLPSITLDDAPLACLK